MTGILIVSFYHLWLGLCILILPVVPKPLGQIEPFYHAGEWMTYNQIGILLITVSLMALTALFLGKFWYIKDPQWRFTRRVALIAPQQIVITYAAYQGFISIFEATETYGWATDYTARLVFGLNISLVFAVLHCIGTIEWWANNPRWKSKACYKPTPCPYWQAEMERRKADLEDAIKEGTADGGRPGLQ
jgi:hypothetical protein